MNILILSFYYKPDLCAGSFRTSSLLKALKKKTTDGDKITLITTFPNRYKSFDTEEPEAHEIIDGVEIFRIKIPSHKSGMLDQVKSFSVFFRKTYNLAKKMDVDIVFATSSRLFTAFLGSIVSRKLKKPLYLDIRDIFVDTMRSVSKTVYLLLKPILNYIEKVTIVRASVLNLVSKGFEPYFKQRYPKTTLSFYPNGIDPEFLDFNFDKEIKSKQIKILYAGNIGQGQGLHRILPQLISKLGDDYFFELIGDGGAKSILTESMKNIPTIRYSLLKPISRDELLIKYKEADILFLHLNDVPAFKKVLPSKLFEFAATGKPILAGVSGFCKEFIEDQLENAEVFHPCNSNEATLMLKKLSLTSIDRQNFINKFKRDNIMSLLVEDILHIAD